MADLRTSPRVAACVRLTVESAGYQARGETENVSERGAMISVDLDPPLSPGQRIVIELELPQRVKVGATVRWASAVLPGVVGVEFDDPNVPELRDQLALLIAQAG